MPYVITCSASSVRVSCVVYRRRVDLFVHSGRAGRGELVLLASTSPAFAGLLVDSVSYIFDLCGFRVYVDFSAAQFLTGLV